MSRESLSPARLEAFSDGVIAVIITVLVLELKVPERDGMAGLRVVAPTVLLYLLTFVQIGIYWVNHHYLIDEVESVGHGILWANLLFLFCLSLFPFGTAWIGARGLTSFATALYAGLSILPGVSYSILWAAVRSQSEAPAHASLGKQIFSTLFYAGAIPVAFYRPMLSLGMISLVAIVWILPPRVEDSARGELTESSQEAGGAQAASGHSPWRKG